MFRVPKLPASNPVSPGGLTLSLAPEVQAPEQNIHRDSFRIDPARKVPKNTVRDMTQRMRDYVQNQGGRIPFDAYMREHLFGTEGYYTKRVCIGVGQDFRTAAVYPLFGRLVSDWACKLELPHLDFLEIGGGEGQFKQNFLRYARPDRFISIDQSPRLISKQDTAKQPALKGSATALPLKDGAVDGVVFSNELIDALPCRVFIYNANGSTIKVAAEAFVSLKNNDLSYNYQPVQSDSFIDLYETYLNHLARFFKTKGCFTVSVAPDTPRVVCEMSRVLKQGRCLICDYGYTSASEEILFQRTGKEEPFCRHFGPDEILKRPCIIDITYNVDFDFLIWLALKSGFELRNFEDQREWLTGLMHKQGLLKKLAGGRRSIDSEVYSDYRALNELHGFRVLELEK